MVLLGGLSGCPTPEDPGHDFADGPNGQPPPTDEESTTGSPQDPTTGAVGSTGEAPCRSDDDCVEHPDGPICSGAGQCTTACTPGQTRSCYSGPLGTEGVGACQAGVNRCSDAGTWELWCDGEVVPGSEICDNGADDDCDGLVDDTDQDGDGFGACSGDCCDISGGACSGAELVNPGAFEVVGNNLDDNCDGVIDEAPVVCDEALATNSVNATDFARAMELCNFTVENPSDPSERTWGVLDARLSLADGQGSPLPVQHALRNGFGVLIDPERGGRMVVLSSGHAADVNDQNPGFAEFESGQNLGTSSPVPADWLDAHGGQFPNPAGCLEPWDTDAHDPVMLTLRVRAPTNASSFSVMMQFFSAEYPEWVCSEFNDFFVALVDGSAENPADKNIAIYDDDNGNLWPVGVNLVMVAEGLFTQCQNGQVGCERNLASDYYGCVGNALLEGTGFDQPDNDACQPSQDQVGGGTGWLRMSGNVTPGEIFEVRFAVWDTSGHIFDSLVLLDDWTWSLEAAEPGVAPG